MQRLLLLDMRPGEGRRVFGMFALIGLIIATSYVLKPVRSALFLTQFGSARLPYVYLAVALVLGVVASAFARVASRSDLPRLFATTAAAFAAALVAFWGLTVSNWRFTGFAFYVFVSIFTALMPSLFWLLANYIFYSNEGRRLFPIVMAGGLLGSILGGALTSLLVPVVGTAGLLLAAALLVAAIAVVGSWNASRERERMNERRSDLSRQQKERALGEPTSPYRMLARSRYLTMLAALIAIGSLVSTLVDFQFNTVVERSFASRDALTEFFGTFFAVINVLAFVLQLLVAPRLLSRFGVGGGLLLLPLALALSSFAFLGFPVLASALLLKSSDDGLSNSVHRASVEVLYLPVSLPVKTRLKAWLDMFVERASRGLAGLTLLAATALSMSASQLGWVVLALLLPWMALAIALQREYVRTFRDSIARRDIADLTSELRDPAGLSVLRQVLSSDDEREILYALELLEGIDDPEIVGRVVALTRHGRPSIRAAALRLLRSLGEPPALEDLATRTRDEDVSTAAEALALWMRVAPEEAGRAFEELVEANDPPRLGAVLDCLEDARTEVATEAVARILASNRDDADPFRRKIAARALGFAPGSEELVPTLLRLVEDEDIGVARAAVQSASRLGSVEALSALVAALGRRPLRAAARRALARFGSDALDELLRRLQDPATPADVRIALPTALAELGDARAIAPLVQLLPEPDPRLHYQTIKALGKLRSRDPAHRPPRSAVDRVLAAERRRLLELARWLASVASTSRRSDAHRLLVHVLEERLEFTRERIFRLLGLIYPQEEILSVWSRVEYGRPAVRAQALEYLANLLAPSDREELYPLLEARSWADVDAGARALRPLVPPSFDVTLQEIADGSDSWMAACAVTLIGEHPVPSLAGTLRGLLAHDVASLREAAERALAKLETSRLVTP